MFDTTALTQTLKALSKRPNANVPKTISTLSAVFESKSLKPLALETEKAANAFGINLTKAGHTFEVGTDKDTKAIRVYEPRVGNVKGIASVVWGKAVVPLTELLESRQVVIKKEDSNFVLEAIFTDEAGQVFSASLGMRIPFKTKQNVKLKQLQQLLGDDETPCTLSKVLDEIRLNTTPAMELADRFSKGTELNILQWVSTGSGDFGKYGYMILEETGDTHWAVPSSVIKAFPLEDFETPDELTFESGECILTIGGRAKMQTGQEYLKCDCVVTRGIDLEGWGEPDAYSYPEDDTSWA